MIRTVRGIMVMLMNKAGGSAAFGRWASSRTKTRTGARCDHVTHVSTQLPYAMTAAAVSAVSYLIAGFIPKAYIALPIAIVLMIVCLTVMRKFCGKKAAKANIKAR